MLRINIYSSITFEKKSSTDDILSSVERNMIILRCTQQNNNRLDRCQIFSEISRNKKQYGTIYLKKKRSDVYNSLDSFWRLFLETKTETRKQLKLIWSINLLNSFLLSFFPFLLLNSNQTSASIIVLIIIIIMFCLSPFFPGGER